MTETTMNASWTDGKRYWWLLSPALPLLVVLGLLNFQFNHAIVGDWGTWGTPFLVYLVLPLFDFLVGTDRSNPPESAIAALERDKYYRWIVYAYVPIQYGATAYGAWLAVQPDTSWLAFAGLVLSIGMINGVGINTAHELGHKRENFERWLARITLAPVAYGHFFVEHNRGHHRNVATPEDPASSRMGESFWAFLPRTMIGSLRSAWSLERERLARRGKSAWHWDNENLQAWAMTVVVFGALTLWLGWAVLPFLLLQAFYGASLLEVVNYIEHYGLLRQKDASGRYVRCEPQHSWNNNHIISNVFLYQLQRHSDHHANPMRRFQALRHFRDSPQLPAGYAGMLLPAYVPFVWYRIMNHRVLAHYNGDITKANLQPNRRGALLRRYGRA